MKLFKRKTENEPDKVCSLASPTVSEIRHPFEEFRLYVPLCDNSDRLYDAIREAVPIVDAAINKIVALVGGFEVRCENEKAERELGEFLSNVKTSPATAGIESFLSRYLDRLLMYGIAIGEIVYDRGGEPRGVCLAPLEGVSARAEGPCDFSLLVERAGERPRKISSGENVFATALNPPAGKVKGRSLLWGLPFVTDILLKIYSSVGVNFERVGNVRFAINYNPPPGSTGTADKARQIASAWSKAMRSRGEVNDFVSVGDIGIKVIGADNQVLDCQAPARLVTEQIVAKTGLPPFLLGLSWSTSERMSSAQCDILTSELWQYRRLLDPVLQKICRAFLRSRGYEQEVTIQWDNISLQDEVELARAELYRAQTEKLR